MKSKNSKYSNSMTMLSFGYWFGARSLGLLVHPYQSVRAVVRDDFYKPLVWLPLVMAFFWWILGILISRISILSKLGLVFLANGLEAWGPTQLVLSFTFVWGVVFFVGWQILLGYLWVRMRGIRL